MHLYLPLLKKDEEAFRRCALQIGFDEFVVHKFLYTMQDSDVDIYQLMYDERLSMLIYGWEICEIHMQNSSNAVASKNYTPTKNVQMIMKWLARYSLDLWLSREWDSCDIKMCKGLMYCLRRVEHILAKLTEVGMLNWNDMFKLDLHPWSSPYVKKFLVVSSEQKPTLDQSIEEIEQPACKQDIDYLKEENIFMIMARLVKMIDSFYLEGAKQLSMRVIAAWNAVFERARDIPGNTTPQIPAEYKQCVINICHIYLMTVYEMDSNRGFVIDNMMNNIRFYHQSFSERNYDKPFAVIAQLTFTPARFIALTCINLSVSVTTFIDMFSEQGAEKNFSTLFGMISQSYISYILGNQLMEMNNMNEEHFNEHIERYKNIFNTYINEREVSEMYLKDWLQRREQQRNSHSMSQIVKILTDFESKFCKGNRSCNMGNCENSAEDEYVQTTDSNLVRDKNTDAIFENMPNNEEILNYVYQMLAERTYDGWHCAKIVLLLKIIGIEVNVIETWRYHPGLTTNFMLNIETKLSKHYEDLALLFHEHFFLEQEFWLTAFYLNPIKKYYAPVIRCGMRFHRILQHVDGETETHVDAADKNEKYAKYGLLSSTIDVKEIVKIRNHDTPNADYDALSKSLSSLKLSEQTVKDLLTVTFLPRNKSFAWALNWDELRKRCRKLLKVPQLKRRLVELNMAEANDRLKYLNINYEKYKNRPQLDYGSIEEGYENLTNFSEKDGKEKFAKDSDDDDEDDDDEDDDDDEAAGVRDNHLDFDEYDDDDDEDDEEMEADKAKTARAAKRSEDAEGTSKPSSQEIEQLVDMYSIGTRRTRARTAAALASANMNIDRARIPETLKVEPVPEPVREKTPIKITKPSYDLSNDAHANVVKRNLKELLKERAIYSNATPGFEPFPDIWDFDAQVLKTVDKTTAVLTETENLFQKYLNLKTNTSKNISPDELSLQFNVESPRELSSTQPDEISLDESTLSATEYDIHAKDDFQFPTKKIQKFDFEKETINKEATDKEVSLKAACDKEVINKEATDKEVSLKAACDKEVFDKEASPFKEISEREVFEKESEEIKSNVIANDENEKVLDTEKIQIIDVNDIEQDLEQDSSKIIDVDETELNMEIDRSEVLDLSITEHVTDLDKSKIIDLEETDQDMKEAERKEIEANETEQIMHMDRAENNDNDTNLLLCTDVMDMSIIDADIIDTDIDESMDVSEIPPKEMFEQAAEAEIILNKAAEDILEEDQQNVVIMLADLTGADESSQQALELISDMVMKPVHCDEVTTADEALSQDEELSQEVQKFTYDDAEENSQSNDVLETTVNDLISEAKTDAPSESPVIVTFTVPEDEDMEMQAETSKSIQTPTEAVLSADEAILASEEAVLSQKGAAIASVEVVAATTVVEEGLSCAEKFPINTENSTINSSTIELTLNSETIDKPVEINDQPIENTNQTESSVVLKTVDALTEVEAAEIEAPEIMSIEDEVTEVVAIEDEVTEVVPIEDEVTEVEATKVEPTKIEATNVEATYVEATKVEATQIKVNEVEVIEDEAAVVEATKDDTTKVEASTVEATKIKATKGEITEGEATKVGVTEVEITEGEATEVESTVVKATEVEVTNVEGAKGEVVEDETIADEATQNKDKLKEICSKDQATENKDQIKEIPTEVETAAISEPTNDKQSTELQIEKAHLNETQATEEESQESTVAEQCTPEPTTTIFIPAGSEIERTTATNSSSTPATKERSEQNITKPDVPIEKNSKQTIEDSNVEEEDNASPVAFPASDVKNELTSEEEIVAVASGTKKECLSEESKSPIPRKKLYKTKLAKYIKKKVAAARAKKSIKKSEQQQSDEQSDEQSEKKFEQKSEALEQQSVQQLNESNFKTKDLLVRIKRLKVTDCIELRQPRVFVERVTKDSVNLKETAVKSSTDTNIAPSFASLRPHRRLQIKRQYSQSSTTTSDEDTMPKMKFARKQTAKRRYVPTGRPQGRPRKLVATPRSASGLKLRISSATTSAADSSSASAKRTNENIELIQISSSSSSSLEIIDSSDEDLHPLPTNLCVVVDHPLYEEEIILCD